MPERGESDYSRDYHIEIINEHVNNILEGDHSDAAKDIATDVAVGQLNEIPPKEGE